MSKANEVKKARKVKSYGEKVAEGQHLVQLWLEGEKYDLVKRAADSVQEPVTTWIRRAIFGSLRHWTMPEPKVNSKLYDPCSICGQRHDKQEHFKGA